MTSSPNVDPIIQEIHRLLDEYYLISDIHLESYPFTPLGDPFPSLSKLREFEVDPSKPESDRILAGQFRKFKEMLRVFGKARYSGIAFRRPLMEYDFIVKSGSPAGILLYWFNMTQYDVSELLCAHLKAESPAPASIELTVGSKIFRFHLEQCKDLCDLSKAYSDSRSYLASLRKTGMSDTEWENWIMDHEADPHAYEAFVYPLYRPNLSEMEGRLREYLESPQFHLANVLNTADSETRTRQLGVFRTSPESGISLSRLADAARFLFSEGNTHLEPHPAVCKDCRKGCPVLCLVGDRTRNYISFSCEGGIDELVLDSCSGFQIQSLEYVRLQDALNSKLLDVEPDGA